MAAMVCTRQQCEGVQWNGRYTRNCFVCGRFGVRTGYAMKGFSGNNWHPSRNPEEDDIYRDYDFMQWLAVI